MPVQIDVSIPIEVIQSIPAIKTVYRSVLENGILYWEVRVAYQDKVVSSKHYNCPYLAVFGGMPTPDMIRAQDFESAMFAKATEIDEMEAGAEKTAMTNIAIDEIKYKEV
jgi:hypothetical protein